MKAQEKIFELEKENEELRQEVGRLNNEISRLSVQHLSDPNDFQHHTVSFSGLDQPYRTI